MTDSVQTRIRDFIVTKYLDGDVRDFDDQTNLLEDRILDSFSAVELMSFLETEFSLNIPPEAVNPVNLQSVAALTKLVHGFTDE